MTVTEIAILRLKEGIDNTNPELKANLRKAKDTMESNTGYPFHYMIQQEGPSLIYIFGEWKSAEYHWKEWIPSEKNKELVDLLIPMLDIEDMFHVDVEPFQLPFDAPVIAIGSYMIPPANKARFEEAYAEIVCILKDFMENKKVACNWRMEKTEENKEEWILICGFNSREHHIEFTNTESFQKFAKLRELIDSFDAKHLEPIEM